MTNEDLELAALKAAEETRAAVVRAELAEAEVARLQAIVADQQRERPETGAEVMVDCVHDTLWSADHRGENVAQMAARVKRERDEALARPAHVTEIVDAIRERHARDVAVLVDAGERFRVERDEARAELADLRAELDASKKLRALAENERLAAAEPLRALRSAFDVFERVDPIVTLETEPSSVEWFVGHRERPLASGRRDGFEDALLDAAEAMRAHPERVPARRIATPEELPESRANLLDSNRRAASKAAAVTLEDRVAKIEAHLFGAP